MYRHKDLSIRSINCVANPVRPIPLISSSSSLLPSFHFLHIGSPVTDELICTAENPLLE